MRNLFFSILLISLSILSANAQEWDGATNTTDPIYRTGNVGIGTISPDSNFKLTVQGNVNIGGTGNFRLRTRHVDGKATNNNTIDDLYLNYDTGKNIFVGYGGQTSNIYVSGNQGIGTTNPLNQLQIGNSMSFHDGGHEVIGFGYAPGSNIDLNPHGYAAEVRLNSYNGDFSFGASSNVTNGPTTRLLINRNGFIGIATVNPSERLTVNGKILCEEVEVIADVVPDYVFQKYYTGSSELKEDYKMPTLEEVEAFTKANHHLPEVPSAAEIKEEGLQLKEMTTLLLQKIEELTLYTIEQEKRIKALEEALAKK